MDFFVSKGLQYILYARHPATLKRYWVFESSEQLNMLLTEWRNRKKDSSAFLIGDLRKGGDTDEQQF